LLEQVPIDQRRGAIIKSEHGPPVRYRSYAKWCRQIAEVCRHSARGREHRCAGGATEVEEALVDIKTIQAA